MDTKGPISPSSDGNSYVYFIVDSFTQYVVLHPSPKSDATNALKVLFDHWIVKFATLDISVTDNGNEYINGEITHFCRTYNVQFKARTPYTPWLNGLNENGNRQLNTFLRTVLDSQYDTWSHIVIIFPFAFNSQVRTNMNLSPYELVFGQKPKKPIMLYLSSTIDSLGNCKPTKNLSLPDLLSRSLMTTTQDEHRLRSIEITDSIKFFMTHNQNTQPIQGHYAASKEHINSISTDTHVESPHFPIYLQIKDNYFNVQLENDLYLPVSHTEF